MAQLGWRLAVRGNFADGIPYLRRAIDRTISPPGWYFQFIAIDDYLKGDYAAMLTDAERSAVDGSAMSLSFIAIAQGALGRQADARATLDKLAEVWPGFMRGSRSRVSRAQADRGAAADHARRPAQGRLAAAGGWGG